MVVLWNYFQSRPQSIWFYILMEHIPRPHAAMLHMYTCNGVFLRCCDVSKSHAMCCNRKFNMLNILARFWNISAIYSLIFKQFSALYDTDVMAFHVIYDQNCSVEFF